MADAAGTTAAISYDSGGSHRWTSEAIATAALAARAYLEAVGVRRGDIALLMGEQSRSLTTLPFERALRSLRVPLARTAGTTSDGARTLACLTHLRPTVVLGLSTQGLPRLSTDRELRRILSQPRIITGDLALSSRAGRRVLGWVESSERILVECPSDRSTASHLHHLIGPHISEQEGWVAVDSPTPCDCELPSWRRT